MHTTDTATRPQPLSSNSVWLHDLDWLRVPAVLEVLCSTSAKHLGRTDGSRSPQGGPPMLIQCRRGVKSEREEIWL